MSAADLTLRVMTAADIPPLLKIERVSFPVPWSAGMFMIQLGLSDETENIVVLSGDNVIGYISSWYGYEEMHILSIAVAPEERGSRAAEMLLDEAISKSREKGSLKVVLEVRVSNHRAIRFYEKHGFTQVGRRKGYYSDSGEDALIFDREIQEPGDREQEDRGED
jgi:ribosomal-protein-alanine N-acetyltransferase